MTSGEEQVLVLGREDVKALLDLDQMIPALERAFIEYSDGRADVPPRTAARTSGGLLGVMPGSGEGIGLGMKAVSVFPGNHRAGLPSHHAVILLFDSENGRPLCVMEGGYLTAMRTAGATAISVKHIARTDTAVLAILGAGVQGESHLELVPRVRDFAEIRVWSRDPRHAADLVRRHPTARAVDTVRSAALGADVVCACTDSPEPIVKADQLSPGCHVTSVGMGRELDASIVKGSPIFVEWRGAAGNPPPTGSAELQETSIDQLTELGEVLTGSRPGRSNPHQITVYKSTGLAIEDLAAARLVYDAAMVGNLGVSMKL